MPQGVATRGSLISVPLALRECFGGFHRGTTKPININSSSDCPRNGWGPGGGQICLCVALLFSGTGMTGRPGHRTMEVNGRSTVSYLVRTPRVPFFMLILIGLEAKNRLAFQGRRGITSVVRWNLRPVIFGVDLWRKGKHINKIPRKSLGNALSVPG